MSSETRSVLLYGQVQEGLLYELLKAPAVSGVQKYSEMCVAARNEEKHVAGLRRCQQLLQRQTTGPSTPILPQEQGTSLVSCPCGFNTHALPY